jgi:ubiquinone/menaquinone biosynthesis C-methylase UbiE
LKSKGFEKLQGLEISDYAIQRLTAEGIVMHKGYLPHIPLPDNSVDLVIASQVLEHIVRRKKFMREINRVLTPAGSVAIFVPDNCLGPISEPEHVVMFNAKTLRQLLEQTFTLKTIESIRDENHQMPILFAHAGKGE